MSDRIVTYVVNELPGVARARAASGGLQVWAEAEDPLLAARLAARSLAQTLDPEATWHQVSQADRYVAAEFARSAGVVLSIRGAPDASWRPIVVVDRAGATVAVCEPFEELEGPIDPGVPMLQRHLAAAVQLARRNGLSGTWHAFQYDRKATLFTASLGLLCGNGAPAKFVFEGEQA